MKIRNDEVARLVGAYCRGFRKATLQRSLSEIAGNTNYKTLSGFENGRSKNLFHIFNYLEWCATAELRTYFLRGLCEILEEVTFNETNI